MSAATRTVLTEKAPWGLVLLLGSLTALGPLAIDMYLPSLPSIAKSLHASSGAVGVTLAAFFAGLGIGQLVFGPLSDRIGRRPVSGYGLRLLEAAVSASSIPFSVAARAPRCASGSYRGRR